MCKKIDFFFHVKHIKFFLMSYAKLLRFHKSSDYKVWWNITKKKKKNCFISKYVVIKSGSMRSNNNDNFKYSEQK